MASAALMAAALLAQQTAHVEAARYGPLAPSAAIDPLDPPLSIAEYEMMERDEGKYVMYFAAMEAAILDIHAARTEAERTTPMVCLVAGAGFGRLPALLLHAAAGVGVNVVVHVFDANALSTEFLLRRFAGEPNVHVHPTCTLPALVASDVDVDSGQLPTTVRALRGRVHLAVAEFLGSFADNEFLPELAAAMQAFFLVPGIGRQIPANWTTYLAPVHCPAILDYLQNIGRPLERGHLVDHRDLVFLAEPIVVYSAAAEDRPTLITAATATFNLAAGGAFRLVADAAAAEQGKQVLIRSKVGDCPATIDGLAGYFSAVLYGDIVLDSRHTSPGRNAYHWEAFLFPLVANGAATSAAVWRPHLYVALERHCIRAPPDEADGDAQPPALLWYTWALDGAVFNRDGASQQFLLG